MITGERVRLRSIEREDLPRFVTWLNDPEIIRGLMINTPLSLPQEERWFQRVLELPVEEQVLVIEVLHEGNWTPAGTTSFHSIDWLERSVEIGIVIGEKRFWNQGFGTDAMQLMVQRAFGTLNLNRVWLKVYETNPGAVHAYEKAGFVLEGRLRQAHFQEGQYVDVLLMSVLRSEWPTGKKG